MVVIEKAATSVKIPVGSVACNQSNKPALGNSYNSPFFLKQTTLSPGEIRNKEQLSTTNLSVTEIAYQLGFEHSQSFSKLFKSKTNQSPLAFRQKFN